MAFVGKVEEAEVEDAGELKFPKGACCVMLVWVVASQQCGTVSLVHAWRRAADAVADGAMRLRRLCRVQGSTVPNQR